VARRGADDRDPAAVFDLEVAEVAEVAEVDVVVD
jgi:hypothetical protein